MFKNLIPSPITPFASIERLIIRYPMPMLNVKNEIRTKSSMKTAHRHFVSLSRRFINQNYKQCQQTIENRAHAALYSIAKVNRMETKHIYVSNDASFLIRYSLCHQTECIPFRKKKSS